MAYFGATVTLLLFTSYSLTLIRAGAFESQQSDWGDDEDDEDPGTKL